MELTDYLRQEQVAFELQSHRPTFTAQMMAAEDHVPGLKVAKPVIVQADGEYYMCVLPACCRVDLGLLRRELDAGEVRLADETEMARLFPECELGAEPPLGNMFGITTLMDKTLSQDDFLVFQAGRHDRSV